MKLVYLLRHAKSSWKEPGLDDQDRPLNKRGRQAAKIMAMYLRRSKIKPDLVICSTAARAKQTLLRIVQSAAEKDWKAASWLLQKMVPAHQWQEEEAPPVVKTEPMPDDELAKLLNRLEAETKNVTKTSWR